jgi:hypothetical protein
VENYYKSPIILRPHGKLPVFRVRLPSYKGNILTEIYNVRKEKINDLMCIQEGDLLVGIVEFGGLMFMSQNFTPCYEMQKIKILKENDSRLLTTGYMFSDMNEKVDLNSNSALDNILEDAIEQPIELNENNIKEIQFNEPKQIVKEIQIIKRAPILTTADEDIDNIKKQAKNGKSNSSGGSAGGGSGNLKEYLKTSTESRSLFDLIKQTTLKDLIIDDGLFTNNNKKFLNLKTQDIEQQKQLQQIRQNQQLDRQQEIQRQNMQRQNMQRQSMQKQIHKTPDLNIGIQNIENINLDIDYELDSPTSQSSPNNELNTDENEDNEDNEEYGEEDEEDEDMLDNDNLSIDENIQIDDNDDNDDNTHNNENGEEGEEEYQEGEENEGEDEYNHDDEDEAHNDDSNDDSENDNGIDYDTLNDLEVMVFDEDAS